MQARFPNAIEPHQVIDIRLEDGMKSEAFTEHVAATASGEFSDAFLNRRAKEGLDKIASGFVMQHDESTVLSNMLS